MKEGGVMFKVVKKGDEKWILHNFTNGIFRFFILIFFYSTRQLQRVLRLLG